MLELWLLLFCRLVSDWDQHQGKVPTCLKIGRAYTNLRTYESTKLCILTSVHASGGYAVYAGSHQRWVPECAHATTIETSIQPTWPIRKIYVSLAQYPAERAAIPGIRRGFARRDIRVWQGARLGQSTCSPRRRRVRELPCMPKNTITGCVDGLGASGVRTRQKPGTWRDRSTNLAAARTRDALAERARLFP